MSTDKLVAPVPRVRVYKSRGKWIVVAPVRSELGITWASVSEFRSWAAAIERAAAAARDTWRPGVVPEVAEVALLERRTRVAIELAVRPRRVTSALGPRGLFGSLRGDALRFFELEVDHDGLDVAGRVLRVSLSALRAAEVEMRDARAVVADAAEEWWDEHGYPAPDASGWAS